MKSIARASILALLLLCAVSPRLTSAQTAGASASGTYKFVLDDDLLKYVDFSASTDDRGVTTGSLVFNDEAKIIYQDVDGTGGRGDEPVPFSMTVAFDGLTVEKNRAIVSGTVRDSSYPSYVGRFVQLVVEDNGTNNPETPDRLVWRLCEKQPGGWVPSDYEVPGDRGAWMSWWATDYEQPGDVGIPSKSVMPGNTQCEVFSLWSYSFADIVRGDGDIVVKP